MVALQYRNSSVARDLAQQITTLLEKNVPKIHVVDQRKVNKWLDENTLGRVSRGRQGRQKRRWS